VRETHHVFGAFHAPYKKILRLPMSVYRRWYQPGGTYFFTVVTYRRRPLFRDVVARRLLGQVVRDVAAERPFQTVAIALLWDHVHCLWSLPSGDQDFSWRWKEIKQRFTSAWLANGGTEAAVTPSQAQRGRRGVWQRRFWEHLIRDEDDFEKHLDYIHFNPVKHGHAARPCDWPWSSFLHYVHQGCYPIDWGCSPETWKHLDGLDWEQGA
jgi:putative transposase